MVNDVNFNIVRYIELLKKEENLINQETFLFYENRNEYSEYCELLSYQIILEDQIYYNGKNDYISLVQEYLDYLKENENAREDKDVAGLFVKEFWSLYRADTRALKILKKEVLE